MCACVPWTPGYGTCTRVSNPVLPMYIQSAYMYHCLRRMYMSIIIHVETKYARGPVGTTPTHQFKPKPGGDG